MLNALQWILRLKAFANQNIQVTNTGILALTQNIMLLYHKEKRVALIQYTPVV